MSKKLLILLALVLNIFVAMAQTESEPQSQDCKYGLVFSDGSTVRFDWYPYTYEETDSTAMIPTLLVQELTTELSFKLYDFDTKTAFVLPLHLLSDWHTSLREEDYVVDSADVYTLAILDNSLAVCIADAEMIEDEKYDVREGTRKGSVSKDGYNCEIYDGYSYYFKDKNYRNSYNGLSAVCVACPKQENISFPSSVNYNGKQVPVRAIGKECKFASNNVKTIRIPASVEVLEYDAFYNICGFATGHNITYLEIEDCDKDLLCSPHYKGALHNRVGAFSRLYLENVYVGRNLKIETNSNYAPFYEWPNKDGTWRPTLNVTFGKKVTYICHNCFSLFRGGSLNVKFETTGTVDINIDNKSGNAAFFHRYTNATLTWNVLAGQKEKYQAKYGAYMNTEKIKLNEYPGKGSCGNGVTWELGMLADSTGYQMHLGGNGKMKDTTNAAYGWYPHQRVLTELIIGASVTYIGKSSFENYPLKAILVESNSLEGLPSVGKDAFRQVAVTTPVYVHNKVRKVLQSMDGWKEFKDFRDLEISEYAEKSCAFIDRICSGYSNNTFISGLSKTTKNSIMNAHRREEVETLEEEFVSKLFAGEPRDGSLQNPYLISNSDQIIFYSRITGDTVSTYRTRCAQMTTDIDASDKMSSIILGKDENIPFQGTFDGNTYSLTLNISHTLTPAAFILYMKSGTVKNLIIKGTVSITGKNSVARFHSGLVGCAKPSEKKDTVLIKNCISAVTLSDNQEGQINLGGLVGSVEAPSQEPTVIVSSSCFVGKIDAPKGKSIGGLIGRVGAYTEVKDCFVDLASVSSNKNMAECAALAYVPSGLKKSWEIDNCYFANIPEFFNTENQGKPTIEEDIRSGKLCLDLNKGVTDGTQAWYQKIGEDKYPHPFSYGNDAVLPSPDSDDYINVTDDLPQVFTPAAHAHKYYMVNGHMIIQCGNQYYDIFGRKL